MTTRARRGATLLELIAVIAVLAVLSGVASFAAGRALHREPHATTARDRARRQAVFEGQAVVVHADSTGSGEPVRFLPDGRVLGGDGDRSRGPR